MIPSQLGHTLSQKLGATRVLIVTMAVHLPSAYSLLLSCPGAKIRPPTAIYTPTFLGPPCHTLNDDTQNLATKVQKKCGTSADFWQDRIWSERERPRPVGGTMKRQGTNLNHDLLCESISGEYVRTALRVCDSVKELGHHPLSDLAAVKVRQQAAGYSTTSVGRGLALRDTLYAAIAALRPQAEAPDHGEKRWRPFLILTEQFMRGRTPDCIAATLCISRRTYYSEQRQAIDKVVDVLCRWESQAQLGQENTATLSSCDSIIAAPTANTILFMAPPRSSHKMIGREQLLHEVKSWLLNGQAVSLGALHGLPGVGKTALAIELAHDPEIQARFRDGILWVGLGRQPDIQASLMGWALALNIPQARLTRCASVAEYARLLHTTIGLRPMLLVIDDAWQLDDALAFKVGGPNCAYIVTTRLASIAMDFAGKRTAIMHELSITDGLSLLAQFAPLAVEVEPEEALALVRAVGCLPLALILMGGYLRRQTYAGQRRRLQQALLMLREAETRLKLAQPQSLLEQPQSSTSAEWLSLHASISLSDVALDATPRQALRDLALFPPKPNTFSEEAMLKVTAAPITVLDTLVDYGLVEHVGNGRYTLHQAIADYARSQGGRLEAAQRLVNYSAQYVTDHSTDFKQLDRELDNILLSLQVAHEIDEPAALLQNIDILCTYLADRGLYTAAKQYLDRAFQAAQIVNHTSHLIAVSRNSGRLAIRQGHYTDAEQHFLTGLKLARSCQMRQAEADCLRDLGIIARHQANYRQAMAYLEQAVNIFDDLADWRGKGLSLRALGVALSEQGDYDKAIAYNEQALLIFRELNDQPSVRSLLNNLGVLHTDRGSYALATNYYQQALSILQATGEQLAEAMLLANMGRVLGFQGQYEDAKILLERALKIGQELDEQRGIGHILACLGEIWRYLGNYPEAQACTERALNIYREIGARQFQADALSSLGMLFHQMGDNQTARYYCEQALQIAEESGARLSLGNILTCLGHALKQLGQLAEAAIVYQQALDLRRDLKRFPTLLDALAGLAKVCLMQGDQAQAQLYADEVFGLLNSNSPAGVDDPFRVYLVCYEILQAKQDLRAPIVLSTAHRLLQERATKIRDETCRRSFLENVPAHRELIVIWKRTQKS